MSDKFIGTLEIEQDLNFQRKEWAIQRVGWVVMLLIVVAAALGLFGGEGPLSQATSGDETHGFSVEYNRFERMNRPTEIEVHATANSAENEIRLWVNRDYLTGIMVSAIEPEPEQVEVAPNRITYTFAASSDSPVTITFLFEVHQFGSLHGRIGIEGGGQLEFSQFVYP